jgi:hypothetical protein
MPITDGLRNFLTARSVVSLVSDESSFQTGASKLVGAWSKPGRGSRDMAALSRKWKFFGAPIRIRKIQECVLYRLILFHASSPAIL